jgi:hypothetical protein
MKFEKGKIVLISAVSLATLASVVAIVPPQTDTGASRALSEPRPPQQQPVPALLSSATTNEGRLAEVASVAETPESAPALAAPAEEQNRTLKDGLRWTFGGKQQRGWAIYVPLIQHLIAAANSTRRKSI